MTNKKRVTAKPDSVGERARKHICETTVALLVERGFSATSIGRIAERANVSKGALQHHFTTKEDLMVAVVNRLMARVVVRSDVSQKKPGETEESVIIREIMKIWTDLINTDPYRALLEILVASRTDSSLLKRIGPVLQDWESSFDDLAKKLFVTNTGQDEDVVMALTMTRVLFRGLVLQVPYERDPSDIENIVKRWSELISSTLRVRDHKSAV